MRHEQTGTLRVAPTVALAQTTIVARESALTALTIMIAASLLILPGTGWAQNQPPICDAGGPYFGLENEPIQFDATNSSDPDGTIVSYLWVFGDGMVDYGPRPTHTFETGGIATLTLRVTDNGGDSSSCNASTNVEIEQSDLPQPRTFGDYITQVESVLPALDPGMLDVQPGPDWFGDMTINRVAGAVNDDPPNTVLFEGDVWVGFDEPDSTSTRFTKLDFNRDYLRYVNQDREFRLGEFPTHSVSETVALTMLWTMVAQLGLPAEEMGSPLVDRVLESGINTEGGQTSNAQVERLVTLPRMINDYPVFGSRMRFAISNLADAARVLVKWRQFELVPDMELLTRPIIVRDIAERIWDAEEGVDVEVNIELGYGWTPSGYAPVARVGVTDIEGILEGGLLEYVPLVNSTVGVPPGAAPKPMLALRVWYSATTERAEIQFALPSAQKARITVYDTTGRAVRHLADRRHLAGIHEIVWDGRNHQSRLVPSGVYFVRLEATGGDLAQKIVVIR